MATQYGAFDDVETEDAPKLHNFKRTLAIVALVGVAAVVGAVGAVSYTQVTATVNDQGQSTANCDEDDTRCNCAATDGRIYRKVTIDNPGGKPFSQCVDERFIPGTCGDDCELPGFCPYEFGGRQSDNSCNAAFNACDYQVATAFDFAGLTEDERNANKRKGSLVTDKDTLCIVSGPFCHFKGTSGIEDTASCQSCLARFAPGEEAINCAHEVGVQSCTQYTDTLDPMLLPENWPTKDGNGEVCEHVDSAVTVCCCSPMDAIKALPGWSGAATYNKDSGEWDFPPSACTGEGDYDRTSGGACQGAWAEQCRVALETSAAACKIDGNAKFELSDCDQKVSYITEYKPNDASGGMAPLM